MPLAESKDNPGLYEQDIHWDRVPREEFYEKKRLFEALISPDVEAILDVGCGDGKITNDLCPGRRVVGCDRSVEALSRVTRAKVLASSDKLPFRDRSFDLVLCSEVLEHLPEPVLLATLQELERIAHAYILISVPYRQTLTSRTTRCGECGAKYNLDGHLRSFPGPGPIARRLTQFGLDFAGYCGPRDERLPAWLPPLRHVLLGDWPTSEVGLCPRCGSKRVARATGARPVLKWFLDRAQWRLESEPYSRWMVLRFRRTSRQDGSRA
jgi:SAM-dependent methyltransferase